MTSEELDNKEVARKMTLLSDEIGIVVGAARGALSALLKESVDLFNETKGFPLSEEQTQLVIAIMDAERVFLKNDDTHLDPMVAVLEELQAKFKACSEALNHQTTS